MTLSDTSRIERDMADLGAYIPKEHKANIVGYIDKNYPFNSDADNGVVDKQLCLAALGVPLASFQT